MSRLLAVTASCALVLLAPSTAAFAVTLDFFCISNNVGADCAAGEAQLTVDVEDAGAGQVSFTFSNSGPAASSITDVYFDDGSLLGIAAIVNTPGMVEFSQNATPGNLPAGNEASPPFVATEGFTADSDTPVQPLGVNPGETLVIIFDLIGGQTFADVLDDLATGALRIGIHAQGFTGGGSESFVNVPVPEPGSAALLAAGLSGLARLRRRG